MASTSETLSLNTSFEPETGNLVDVVEGIGRVTAPNRGPFTFTGTNTFLLGVDRLLVIDPGLLGAEVRYEEVPGAELPFPHVFGPVNVDAVVDVRPFAAGPDGTFTFTQEA